MSCSSRKPALSSKLLGAFDLVASFSWTPTSDMEFEAIDHILGLAAGAESITDQPSTDQIASLGRLLERHMAEAACMQQPMMTPAAARFLRNYFMVSVQALKHHTLQTILLKASQCASVQTSHACGCAPIAAHCGPRLCPQSG